MTAPPQSYLDLYLSPIRPYLDRPDVTDIYVNRVGELWVESLGGAVERREEPALDEAHLWRLARQIASCSNQGVSARHPLLSAALPDGSRVQIVTPPATRSGVAVAIRRHAALSLDLASYRDDSAIDWVAPAVDLSALAAKRDYTALLAHAVRGRKNILISGGTSTGKTTLLNSLLQKISPVERLICIEDAPELRLAHENSVGLVAVRGRQGEAEVNSEDLLQAALRMRPDRIILGELRGPEAFTFLRAINTGHPGSLSTIHADTPQRALVQLALLAMQAGVGLSFPDAHALVREMVDVVVQVERVRGARRIADVIVREMAGDGPE